MRADDLVTLDGATLRCAEVAAVGRRGAPVAVAADGLARAAASHAAARNAVGTGAFYGRTTGVGANSGERVAPGGGHGLRLLRSHAGGAGERVGRDVARGALAIRLNQLAAGGSGADPAWLGAVADALNAGLTPEFAVLGAIGTGDLTGARGDRADADRRAAVAVGRRPADPGAAAAGGGRRRRAGVPVL